MPCLINNIMAVIKRPFFHFVANVNFDNIIAFLKCSVNLDRYSIQQLKNLSHSGPVSSYLTSTHTCNSKILFHMGFYQAILPPNTSIHHFHRLTLGHHFSSPLDQPNLFPIQKGRQIGSFPLSQQQSRALEPQNCKHQPLEEEGIYLVPGIYARYLTKRQAPHQAYMPGTVGPTSL